MVSRLLHHQTGVHHDGLEPEMSASLDTRPIPTREVSGGEVGPPLGEVQKSTNRHSKRWVKEAFEHRPENAEKQATCRYCHKVRSTLNPTRQKEHLLNKKECQYLQSEDARMSTDPEVQSILAGGSLHPTPRRPKSEREPGSSGQSCSRTCDTFAKLRNWLCAVCFSVLSSCKPSQKMLTCRGPCCTHCWQRSQERDE